MNYLLIYNTFIEKTKLWDDFDCSLVLYNVIQVISYE
jgi:hypothetical protein